VAYAFSDLSVVAMTKVLAPHNEVRDILLCVCLVYAVCGGIGAVLAGAGAPEDRTLQKWKDALPVAATWFAAAIFLFICFRLLGAVFGNIVQSMRGPFSILFGVALAARGHVHIEDQPLDARAAAGGRPAHVRGHCAVRVRTRTNRALTASAIRDGRPRSVRHVGIPGAVGFQVVACDNRAGKSPARCIVSRRMITGYAKIATRHDACISSAAWNRREGYRRYC
jgi:hypothetical protein